MMTAPAVAIDLALPGGRVRAHRRGPRGGTPVVCIPGLSANALSFDLIAERLAADGRDVLALDLRGRGHSPDSGRGSYGWPSHARDVLAAGAHAGAADGPVDLVGHSMGAFVAMQAAATQPRLVRRIVLIDAAGPPEPSSLVAIGRAVARLGARHPSVEAYIARVREIGSIRPWHDLWERYLRYELAASGAGVRPRTSAPAVGEDLEYGSRHDPRALWPRLRGPALLVRAAEPIAPGEGFIVSADDAGAFARQVPCARVVEVPANHYGVMTSPEAIEAVAAFLAEP